MKQFKALLVDIDGTVADCEKRNRNVLESVATAHGGQILPQDWLVLAGTSDHFIHGWLAKKFSAFKIGVRDFVDEVKCGYLRRSFEVVAREGIMESFLHIQGRGIKIAAVTNSPSDIAASNLVATKCDKFMEFVMTATDVERAGRSIKPMPDPYLMAAERLHVDPASCLVLEDSGSGTAAALAAGSTVIQIVDDPVYTVPAAHYHAHNPLQLKALCKQLIP